MATDLARVSFDRGRRYTGVVRQQGRVTLEAEENEERTILSEERRLELLDVVGPAGTPDDGYAISAASGFDFTIGAGTMYVGGQRVELDDDILYSAQPDWLDFSDDPDWVDPTEKVGPDEHVVLVLEERDVTAVEDPPLREVALGGPDGAGRTILLQRVERKETQAQDCADALASDEVGWQAEGLTFDPDTMQLESDSRLLVSWDATPEVTDPCEPSSTGGYLGAENQLIRVQVTAVDDEAGTFDVVWGWDNASFLYRVTPDASTNPVLTLARNPVDDFHRPRAGQAVQVLRSAAELQATDGVVEGYVAALHGQVGVLGVPYDPDTNSVQFPSPLPTSYTDAKQTPQLYLRVWEEQLTGNTVGQPITLTGTGVQVTITVEGTGPLHVDDFWCIGVRPSTSTEVYPERFLRTPQPPDGPSLWACPLAVIAWPDGQDLEVVEDCRNHFRPLIDGSTDSGCCTVEVRPSDARGGRLQKLIDAAVAGRLANDRSHRLTICFGPGRYELERPIVLRSQHGNLTLQGCSEGAILGAAEGFEKAFAQGLIVAVDANNVTIRGFELELPQVPADLARVRDSHFTEESFTEAMNFILANRYVSIGIRPVHCAVLAITDCLFRFSVGEHVTTPEVEQTMPRTVFAAGVFAGSECWGLQLEGNRFLHDPALRLDPEGPQHALVGYLLTPTTVTKGGVHIAIRELEASVLRALLQDAVIRNNVFDGITTAVLVLGDLGGIRIWDNVVRRCYGGIFLLDAMATANTNLGGRFVVDEGLADAADVVRSALASSVLDQLLLLIITLATTFPLPDQADLAAKATPAVKVADLEARRAAAEQTRRSWMSQFVKDVASGLSPLRTVGQRVGQTTTTVAAQASRTTKAAVKKAVAKKTKKAAAKSAVGQKAAASKTTKKTTKAATKKATKAGAKKASKAGAKKASKAGRATRGLAATRATATRRATKGASDRPARAGAATSGATTSAVVDGVQDTAGEEALLREGSLVQQQLRIAHAGLLELARLAGAGEGSRLSLRLERNDITCGLEQAATSGPAAFVFVSRVPQFVSSAEVSNNRLSSTGFVPSTAIIGVATQAITGNILTTTNRQGLALLVAASDQVAITGNVFAGETELPGNRPFPPPFDTWLPLNAAL